MAVDMVAKRRVHVAGVGACAQGAVLADTEPLVAAMPAAFEPLADAAAPKPRRRVRQVLGEPLADAVPLDDVEEAD